MQTRPRAIDRTAAPQAVTTRVSGGGKARFDRDHRGLALRLAATPAPPPAEPVAPVPPTVPAPPPQADQPAPVLVGTVLKVTDGDTIKVQLSSGPVSVRLYSIKPRRRQTNPGARDDGTDWRTAGSPADRLESGNPEPVRATRQRRGSWRREPQSPGWWRRTRMGVPRLLEGSELLLLRGRRTFPRPRTLGPACELNTCAVGMASTRARGPRRDSQLQPGDSCELHRCDARPPRPDQGASAVRPGPAPVSSAPAAGCRVKGNISQNGKIYHVPGSPSYDQTKIERVQGRAMVLLRGGGAGGGMAAPRLGTISAALARLA